MSEHQPASYPLHVVGAHEGEESIVHFDPAEFFESGQQPLHRSCVPVFLPIISSNTLALTLLKRANGPVDGFVIEGATAGGHNAPPRGKLQLNEKGEPVYGVRDAIDLAKIRELGVALLAGRWLRLCREAASRALARRRRNPGGHGLRLLRRIRPARRL